jgi:hypothetical protein
MLMPHLQAAFYPAEKRGEVSFFHICTGTKKYRILPAQY